MACCNKVVSSAPEGAATVTALGSGGCCVKKDADHADVATLKKIRARMSPLKLPAIRLMRPLESSIVIMANLLLVAGKRHKGFQIRMSFREPNFHPLFRVAMSV